MKKAKLIYALFITTFITSITTNGGYAIVAVLKEKFTKKYKLISEKEMIDLISLSSSVPGPIAVNTSVVIGYKLLGFLGSIIAVIGVILPPLIIMSIITYLYDYLINNELISIFLNGMSFGVCALITSVFLDMFIDIKKNKSLFYYLLIVFSFIFVMFSHYSIFILVIICLILSYINAKKIIKEVKND